MHHVLMATVGLFIAFLAFPAQDPRPKTSGTTIALAALSDGGLAVVDPSAGRLLKRIDGLSEATFGVAVNPVNSGQAWAVGEKNGLLYELDLSAMSVRNRPAIRLSGLPDKAVEAHQPVVSGDGKFVLVAVTGDNTLTVVNTETSGLTKIPMPHEPHIVDIDPVEGHVFVSRRGAERGVTFLDFRKLRDRFTLGSHPTLPPALIDELVREGAYLSIPIAGAPRVVSALGGGRFAVALYGRRGPLVYQVKDGKAALVDDLDNLVTRRPRAPKANLEYLEGQWLSGDGRLLVGTDQGVPPCLSVWDLGPDGRGLREARSIELPAEPYWVNVSRDGATAWVSVPKHRDAQGKEVTGRVLTVDIAKGKVLRSVPIDDDGKVHSPKRMVIVDLPNSWIDKLGQ